MGDFNHLLATTTLDTDRHQPSFGQNSQDSAARVTV